jgi:hypothetical protein
MPSFVKPLIGVAVDETGWVTDTRALGADTHRCTLSDGVTQGSNALLVKPACYGQISRGDNGGMAVRWRVSGYAV